MPVCSVAVRSLIFAVLGLAPIPAFAQGSNVTAFNPYSGIGLPGGPVPAYGAQAAYPIVDTVGPAGGPAFNPWQSAGVAPDSPADQTPAYAYNPGSYLPAPPPGPVESRIVAIPERGDASPPRSYFSPVPTYVPPKPTDVSPVPTVTPPTPAPVAMPAVAPPNEPVKSAAATPAIASTPSPTPTPTPSSAPPVVPPAAVMTTPQLVPPPSVSGGAVAATIAFAGQSAELGGAAKADLDRVAKNLAGRGLRQIELRAYAGGGGPESRKVSLARALVVRSYLIDKGVKSRIEVGAYGGDGGSGGSERVDIVVPNS